MMLPDNMVQEVLGKQKKAFDEIIYCLTEPGVPLAQITRRLQAIKARTNEILQSLVNFKQSLSDPTSISQVDTFLKENITRYNTEMNKIINSTGSSDYEYSKEIHDEAVRSSPLPEGIGTANAKSIATAPVDSERLATPAFKTQTAEDIMKLNQSMMLNPSWGIDIEDGQSVSVGYNGELYYVINPITQDGKIKMIRFIDPGTMSQYVHDNYSAHGLTPTILFGKTATLTYAVNVTI